MQKGPAIRELPIFAFILLFLSQSCFLFLLRVWPDGRDGESLTLIYRDAFIAL